METKDSLNTYSFVYEARSLWKQKTSLPPELANNQHLHRALDGVLYYNGKVYVGGRDCVTRQTQTNMKDPNCLPLLPRQRIAEPKELKCNDEIGSKILDCLRTFDDSV